MRRNDFMEELGFRYIANHATGELHRVKDICRRCGVDYVARGGYCTALWAWVLRRWFGYDGCYYCNRGQHYK